MIILGIDPGIAITGYGIVKYEGNKFTPITYGAITTDTKSTMPERLMILHKNLEELISLYKPDVFAVEELFFNKNVKTALVVGHARGVVMLTAVKHNLGIYEYTPLQVKQAVVGYGRAEKQQIQQMVRILLNLEGIPKPDDVADALAVAICHGNSHLMGELFRVK
ncbi:crossover junction endodeoxyribonuclease RuvC [Oxobacter pfennigii]|uniref:Crossover junction endodeoxyribonuclease RuvC n=1 Tax=Oxobacter pfennigii TaxID=36849 RepID=A0A0P9AHR2_9CLOT|nr:crossover junction endodeoxyribonuclease RuvC [Oxobacter pfennigii]KPU44997.1 crossover junction endodeoxyribonuclease RuvC [Oxobacter pfennigii]